MLAELSGAAWEHPHFDGSDVRSAHDVVARYHDQHIGITDASLVVLAERYRTNRILTLDHRHFSALRTSKGEPFELLP